MEGACEPSRHLTFPKAARVRSRREFLALQGTGRRLSARHFLMVFDDRSTTGPQLGLTVTKKIGGAVTRNLLKRRLREIFRHTRSKLPEHLRVVIVVREGAPRLSFAETSSEILPLFEAIGSAPLNTFGRTRPAAGRS